MATINGRYGSLLSTFTQIDPILVWIQRYVIKRSQPGYLSLLTPLTKVYWVNFWTASRNHGNEWFLKPLYYGSTTLTAYARWSSWCVCSCKVYFGFDLFLPRWCPKSETFIKRIVVRCLTNQKVLSRRHFSRIRIVVCCACNPFYEVGSIFLCNSLYKLGHFISPIFF